MRHERRQHGAVLVSTLYTALLVAVFAMGAVGLSTVDLQVSTNQIESLQAYYVAEAGVADALSQMRQGGVLTDGTWNATFPAGSDDQYTVTVSDGGTRVRSRGQAAPLGFQRTVEVGVGVSGTAAPFTVRVQTWQEVGP